MPRIKTRKPSIQQLVNTTVDRLEIITNKCKDPWVIQELNTLMIDLSVYSIPTNNSHGKVPEGMNDFQEERFILDPSYDEDAYSDILSQY